MKILGLEREYLPLKQAAQELQISQEDLLHAGACGAAQICVDLYGGSSGQTRTRIDEDGGLSAMTASEVTAAEADAKADIGEAAFDEDRLAFDTWRARCQEKMPAGIYELPVDVMGFFESPDTASVELFEAYKRDETGWWSVEFIEPPTIRLRNLYLLKGEVQRLRGEPESAPKVSKQPLGTRERDTLLVIIAALSREAKIDISKPSKAASLVEGLTDQLGAPVSKRAIEEHLKNVSGALSSRSR